MALESRNDWLVQDLCADPDYAVDPLGVILRKGKPVGRTDRDGYTEVYYKRKRLKAHRIVFYKVYGYLRCDMVIDHKDKNRKNNQPGNLQLCTPKTNNIWRHKREREECVA